ncbi:hypothetical protein [Nocardia sp. NRRL S-836]|uniref:hypothetical protein n=1 Tax=Nocardia sp. NRRL S-836 TaxID=1519492 RepID=UPI0006AFECC2|nr:hypothetical protein [Nocardia sp. NRRL S-836]KOV86334.1 hypothetical protein ADL03_09350 [Nocardia sp. NRRL S-836]
MADTAAVRAKKIFDELAEELAPSGVDHGSLFGKPCLKTGGKAFACQFKEGVAFKLPAQPHAEALALSGAVLFDPSGKGRPMKEWVLVPVKHSATWPEFAAQARKALGG